MPPFLMKACRTNAGPVLWNPNNPNHQDVRPGSLGLLEAQNVNAPLWPPTERLVEVRDAGHMGLGLFAKVDIPRGARILAELPIFALPAETPLSDHSSDDEDDLLLRHPDKGIENFVDQVDLLGLNSEYIVTMETLDCNEEAAEDQDIKDLIKNFFFQRLDREWRRNRAMLGLDPPVPLAPLPLELQEELNAREIDRYTRLWAIWANNRVKFGEGATMASGVFLHASRINHSCCPNAWYDFNPHVGNREPRIEMLTTHTIRDIAAGEQILVAYDAMSLKLRDERTERLAMMWDVYDCGCALCTDPLVEALQQRAYRLWQAANDWVRPWPLTGLLASAENDSFAPCKDGLEALKMGEEVIALLTHPVWNVREMALAEAYKLCSIICERLATDPEVGLSYAEAVHYWERAMRFSGERCQVYMMLVGTDGREMKMADQRFKELGERRARWAALQDRWRWPPRP